MFVYTRHAKTRIKQRNLSVAQIEETVLHPDRAWPGFRKRVVARKEFSDGAIEVVYRQQGDVTVIVTAYQLEE